jgi:hypothetical protein
MKILILTAFSSLFLFNFTAAAQNNFDYGQIADLKGLTKIFVDAGADLKNRERIIKTLEKEQLPNIEILNNGEGAEILMVFHGESEEVIQGATSSYGTTNIIRSNLASGTGLVLVDGVKKPKLILSVSNTQQDKLEKRPATKFALAFIKAYKQANGLK